MLWDVVCSCWEMCCVFMLRDVLCVGCSELIIQLIRISWVVRDVCLCVYVCVCVCVCVRVCLNLHGILKCAHDSNVQLLSFPIARHVMLEFLWCEYLFQQQCSCLSNIGTCRTSEIWSVLSLWREGFFSWNLLLSWLGYLSSIQVQ